MNKYAVVYNGNNIVACATFVEAQAMVMQLLTTGCVEIQIVEAKTDQEIQDLVQKLTS